MIGRSYNIHMKLTFIQSCLLTTLCKSDGQVTMATQSQYPSFILKNCHIVSMFLIILAKNGCQMTK